jgi:hypothetical protein
MTEADAFEHLRSALVAAGLSWLVSQVDEEIVLGRTVAKLKASSDRGPIPSEPRFEEVGKVPPSQRARAPVTSVPYSDQERLQLLVKSIRATVVAMEDVRLRLFESVARIPEVGPAIRFVPEEEEEEGRVGFTLEGAEPDRRQAVGELRRLLDELQGAHDASE